MQAQGVPNPFPAAAGFQIVVTGGLPPYTFTAAPSPPNPPGVLVTPDGEVRVPSNLPPGTDVYVDVTDSSVPPQTVRVVNRTV